MAGPTKPTVSRSDPSYPGQAAYTAVGLAVYDALVYRFNLPVLWRCSKRDLIDLYDRWVSGSHLDIGVATGALLDGCSFPDAHPRLTLMDLNPEPLASAARRLRRYAPKTHQANVLTPWGLPSASFESVAMMNLLHCVPGPIGEKAVAFDHASSALAPGGTLFGATILGQGVTHTRSSAWVMKRLNRTGVFSNIEDSLDDLHTALSERFLEHEVDVRGSVALFVARTAR
ncbi:MAG: hypothetical protein QOF85_1513 [Solirubrobacterales bacterium]|jgi:hypothetical protein|nr:hypothetical protein [Solirubrobacterales bacterium]